jgi:acetamidase/formamidase
MEIQPNDTVVVHTLFGMPTDMHPDRTRIPPELTAIHENVERDLGPHFLTGPIYIKGAEPGDVLVVKIRDIRLRLDWGHNRFMPGKGTLPEIFPKFGSWVIEIDKKNKTAQWIGDIKVPLDRPFFGNIGVAPLAVRGRVSSRIPNEHGGNLDNKELVAGSTLYLPVFNPGGLLSIGDGHAAQGDGEVDGTAVETGLTGEFEISLRKDISLRLPQAEIDSHYITMGFDPDLDIAAKTALREMLDHMVTAYDLSREEAYSLCTAIVDLRITQTVNGNKGAHAMLPKAILDG